MRLGRWRIERRSAAAAAAAGGGALSPYAEWVQGARLAGSGSLGALGVVEGIASRWERAVSAASVTGERGEALDPVVLGMIGRQLLLRGESLHLIEVRGGRIALSPASWWDVQGRGDRGSWFYRGQLAGPDWSRSFASPAAGVLHVVIGQSALRPWRGRSPVRSAAATLGESVESAVSAELRKLAAQVVSGGDRQFEAKLRQATARVDDVLWAGSPEVSAPAQWGEAPRPVNVAQLGPRPSSELGSLRDRVERTLWMAAGLPVEWLTGGAGPALREGGRTALHWTFQPIVRLIAAEASLKLGGPVSLSLERLQASDVAGRARAFGILKGAEVETERALRLSGLSTEGEADLSSSIG